MRLRGHRFGSSVYSYKIGQSQVYRRLLFLTHREENRPDFLKSIEIGSNHEWSHQVHQSRAILQTTTARRSATVTAYQDTRFYAVLHYRLEHEICVIAIDYFRNFDKSNAEHVTESKRTSDVPRAMPRILIACPKPIVPNPQKTLKVAMSAKSRSDASAYT